MKGSQAMLGGGDRGVELPGMDFSEGGFTIGGIDAATEIPNGMLFIPSSVPDGEVVMNVASSSSGLSECIRIHQAPDVASLTASLRKQHLTLIFCSDFVDRKL